MPVGRSCFKYESSYLKYISARPGDNVASGTLPGLQDLSIQPKAVEEVVPTYIRRPRASEPD
jgi:hypothetical protein